MRVDTHNERLGQLLRGVIAVLGLYAVQVPAQDQAPKPGEKLELIDDPFLREPPAVAERREAVQAELRSLATHAWAGEYHEGDGRGANIDLALAPGAGVAATWRGCLGVYSANEGTVRVRRDGHLAFDFAAPNQGSAFGGFADELVPVRWGDRRYLIAPREMVAFVSAVNRNREPRTNIRGNFLMALGDESKPADGLPDLPAEFLSHIRSLSMSMATLAVAAPETTKHEAWCEKKYRVTVDRGSADGLLSGQELDVEQPVNVVEPLILARVERHRATGVLWMGGVGCDAIPVPDAKWSFSTDAYDAAAARSEIDEANARTQR